MNRLKPGDRVTSNVAGYYQGLPGTLKGRSLVQYEKLTKYTIDLDIGKSISLKEYQLKKIDDEY